MEREIIDGAEYLQIIAVKSQDKVEYYEIKSLEAEGFYRISEDSVETGKVYFPGTWKIEDILKDISRVPKE